MSGNRHERSGSIKWVPLSLMKVSERAQRDFKIAWAREIADDLDPERLGIIAVSHRDGHYYIIDGQHRVEAMRIVGWGDQQVQCDVYENLTEAREAEAFLVLNNRKNVTGYTEFRLGVVAERAEETHIKKIVEHAGMSIARTGADSIACVGALRKVYHSGGPTVLAQALHIAHAVYGQAPSGLMLEALGLICSRYGEQIDAVNTIEKLTGARGGEVRLLQDAETLRKQTGVTRPHSIAASMVDRINAGRGGRKLPDWWRSE